LTLVVTRRVYATGHTASICLAKTWSSELFAQGARVDVIGTGINRHSVQGKLGFDAATSDNVAPVDCQ
jgi:hypothetical protein